MASEAVYVYNMDWNDCNIGARVCLFGGRLSQPELDSLSLSPVIRTSRSALWTALSQKRLYNI